MEELTMKKLLLVAALSTLTACGSEDVFGDVEEESQSSAVSAVTFTEMASEENSPVYDFDATYTENGSEVVGEELIWYWSVNLPGEGEVASLYPEEEPQYKFTEAATYQITVSVSDKSGKNLAQHSKNIVITADDVSTPVVLPNPVIELISKNLLAVRLDAKNSTYSNGQISDFEWIIDGTTFNTPAPTHEFSQPGSHTIHLKVTTDDQLENSTSKVIIIASEPTLPATKFTYTKTKLKVDFDASKSDNHSSGIASYEWDFGSGTQSTGIETSTTYPAEGPYDVTLTVTTQEGLSQSVTETINLYEEAKYVTCDVLTTSSTLYKKTDEDQCFSTAPISNLASAEAWCSAEIQKYIDGLGWTRFKDTTLTWQVRQQGNNEC
jgi:PKD repeat protein